MTDSSIRVARLSPEPVPLKAPPIVLSAAGSDCSSGAGIQADLKTFLAHGCYGLTAISAVVAESAKRVVSVEPVSPERFRDQLDVLLEDYPSIGAMKTGLLPSPEHVKIVADSIRKHRPGLPLVIDPVAVASTGTVLAVGDLLGAFHDDLIPLAALLTPNRDEAELLLRRFGGWSDGDQISDSSGASSAAALLADLFKVAVLLKGGHIENSETAGRSVCEDHLARPGDSTVSFSQARIELAHPAIGHGTGCVLSAGIAARLAHGDDLETAIVRAQNHLNKALADGFVWQASNGRDIAAMNHGESFRQL